MEYTGTYSKDKRVGVVLTLASHFCLDLDVNIAFFRAALVLVDMEIPLGFETHSERKKVCLLKKAFYGFKESRRAWL